jgi:hypothetical protein
LELTQAQIDAEIGMALYLIWAIIHSETLAKKPIEKLIRISAVIGGMPAELCNSIDAEGKRRIADGLNPGDFRRLK